MKFGVSYNTAFFGPNPDQLIGFAQAAEECGFESLYVPEHIALYPGAKAGLFDFPPNLAVTDPLDTLTFVAAATSRILLGTAVLLLPYHHPVVLAKRLATIDQLSRGRMRLVTVGVGALPGEAAAVGVDFRTRGRRADEALDVLRLLWNGDEAGVDFDGEFFTFSKICVFPKPYKGGVLPIHIGGSSSAAARRAGLRGDGYFPGGGLTVDMEREQLSLMRDTAARENRDPLSLEVTRWGSVNMTPADVERRAQQGVTRIVISPGSADPDEQRHELETFAMRHHLGSHD
jgi:probable F420-dependent oxidoreductase